MDDLDKLHRRLVATIRTTRPEYLSSPFTVRDLYERLVAYRHNRRELGIETNDEYEHAVARLISGERGYISTDPSLQESLRRELASPTGDPGIFKDHGDAQLMLGSEAAVSSTTPAPAATTVDSAAAPAQAAARSVAQPAMPSPSSVQPPAPVTSNQASLIDSISSPVPTGCRFCGGTLPEGRDIHYCPHCGENLRTQRCSACGAEMDSDWKFCVICGKKT